MSRLEAFGLTVVLALSVATYSRCGEPNSGGTGSPPLDAAALKDLLKPLGDQLNRFEKQIEGIRRTVDPQAVDALRKQVKDLEQQRGKQNKGMEDLNRVEKQIEDLRRTVDPQPVDTLRKQLKDLEQQLKKQNERMEDFIRLQTAQMENLTQSLADLKRQGGEKPPSRSVAASNPGTIRLLNTSSLKVSVIIDDSEQANPLEPGASVTLSHPAGPFTYEVLGLGVPYRQVRELKPSERFDIELYDKARGPSLTTQK